MVIIILGIAIPTSIYVLGALTRRSVEAEKMTVAANLAQGLMEEIRSKSFNEVDDFDGYNSAVSGFSGYTATVSVYYVNASDLDTAVTGPTDYKRVEVTIFIEEEVGISLVTLVGGY